MKKRLKKILHKVRAQTIVLYYYYYKLLYSNQSTGKAIFITFNSDPWGRYLYLLIKFFHLRGYRIYLGGSFELFYSIKKDKHAAYIFSEKLISIGKPPKGIPFILFNEEKLSVDYFAFLRMETLAENAFYIPMAQHPIMYHFGWWNSPLANVKRKRSLFMAGNFDENQYSRNENEVLFGVTPRFEIYAHLNKKGLLFPANNFTDIKGYLESNADNKIVLIDSLKTGGVPMNLLRQTLSVFDFFFALPGVVMPFSHNIVEAMSAGCIPFIQESYAKLFNPALCNGLQAVTFTDTSDLEERISYLFSLTGHSIETMRNEVVAYYNNFLTPESVVRSIENNNFSTIYLQAEGGSVALLKKADLRLRAL